MAEVKIPTRASSQVDGATYDEETGQMTVSFKSGAVYLYSGVDQEDADDMATTPWNDMRQRLLDYVRVS